MSTKYIGADVDCKMTELAVERNGKIILRERVPTTIPALRQFLSEVPGLKVMAIEEGPMAGWLYRNLRDWVDRLVVCDPRRNKLIASDGDKNDPIDASKLAILLRGDYVREIYHTEDTNRLALKEMVGIYHDRVREAVRQTNKTRGRCRAYGLRIPRIVVRDPSRRSAWLGVLKHPTLAWQLGLLWIGLDAVIEQVQLARREIRRLSKSYDIIRLWTKVPGIGPIRASTFFAYIDTPWRFKGPKKLWKYCGVGLHETASGSDRQGRPRTGKRRLFRAVNRRLKDVAMGGAISAIEQGQNRFAEHYRRMLRDGVAPCNARHTVARKILTVMWGMWKTNERYDENLV